MYFRRHVKDWWFEPHLPKKRIRIPSSFGRLDPCDPSNALPALVASRVGAFKHSRHWVRYNRLQPIDSGYITPLYDLNSIATRYGLSANGQRYFRKHILPEPFDIVRRRSVHAHHWSRFTLMVLDTVLLDLQKNGYTQFLKTFEDHVELLHTGVAYLQDYYAHKAENQLVDSSDKHGVRWLE